MMSRYNWRHMVQQIPRVLLRSIILLISKSTIYVDLFFFCLFSHAVFFNVQLSQPYIITEKNNSNSPLIFIIFVIEISLSFMILSKSGTAFLSRNIWFILSVLKPRKTKLSITFIPSNSTMYSRKNAV